MDQTRIDELSSFKILVALALGPVVMAVTLIMVVIVAPLALVMGIPYCLLAKQIHQALVDQEHVSPYLAGERSCACDSQSLIPAHNL